jgi:short-subunit dehydrogenase
VVTGASSGIGEATARELASRGWLCVLLARRTDRLERIASEIGGEWELCDVAERDQVEAVAARVLERHPRISLLVNNAGIPGRGAFMQVDPELIERVTRVNYLGGVWALRAFFPGLQAAAVGGADGSGGADGAGRAHVVNLVSVAGTIAFAPAGPYTASKHAQLAFSRSTAALLRGSGISVHAVLPGFVETEGFPQRAVLRSPVFRRLVIGPRDVALQVVKSVERDRREVFVPRWYRLFAIAQAVVPGLVARMAGRSGYRAGST